MAATIPFNYVPTTNAAGSFTITNDGDVQGVQMDDPATRYALRSGYVLGSETLPMWGGVGIFEDVPPGLSIVAPLAPDGALGSGIGRATAISGGSAVLSGFSVFNQTHNAATHATVAGADGRGRT
jgi:hypothetical protein